MQKTIDGTVTPTDDSIDGHLVRAFLASNPNKSSPVNITLLDNATFTFKIKNLTPGETYEIKVSSVVKGISGPSTDANQTVGKLSLSF